MSPYFFGYGSLVNCQTHTYPDPRPAKLQGWRRTWVRCSGRDIVYLSVIPDTSCTIDGLIAAVPNADWVALDAREGGYSRIPSDGAVLHDLTPAPDLNHYAVCADNIIADGPHAILLSYLDVVVQGFHEHFGTDGVQRFFDTTDGWDTTPVLNDRAAPRYPRAQQLTSDETALVDHHLKRLSAQMQ